MARIRILFPFLFLAAVLLVVVASNRPSTFSADGGAAVTFRCPECGMDVAPDTSVHGVVDGVVRYFCSRDCLDRSMNPPRLAGAVAADRSRRLVDPVCGMEVNPSWGIHAAHGGGTYYFCSARCRDTFVEDPAFFLSPRCPVCDVVVTLAGGFPATYLGRTYTLCSAAHRREFKADPASFFMHRMWGIPGWLYYCSIAVVLIISFGLFDWLGRRGDARQRMDAAHPNEPGAREPHARRGHARALPVHPGPAPAAALVATPAFLLKSLAPRRAGRVRGALKIRSDRFDLFSIAWVRSAACSRVFRFVCQLIVAGAFGLIIAAGLLGNQNPAMNIAPILTWTVWWGLLIIFIMFAGKAWCYVCPWDAIAGWAERLTLWRKTDDGLSLHLRWPRAVRNILIATLMFVGLTWIELGFGVTMKPRVTAYLAVAMLLMATVAALLFDRRSFCRYGCLVGRVSGLYALFAGVEVRARDRGVCDACRGKECVKGSETAYGCPTYLYPGKLETNTYCIQCMECVQACPRDNIALNVRPWGSDLAVEGKPRADEAYLALLMLAITGFHGLTMTPAWARLVDGLRASMDVGRVAGFSAGMTLLMVGPIAVYALLVAASRALAGRAATSRLTYRDYFIRYAYALLPIALFYHIAHNLEHLLMEGPKVVAMMSDPFGWGWNILGTARWTIPPLVSLGYLWVLQVLLVLVGHVYGLWIAQRTSRRLFGSARTAFRSQVPMLIGMIAFSVFSLWLLKQPMEMRTTAM